ncbi:hypothetical protein SPBR_04435 [Sporothrix brasiliensis 5110]|uniref:EF-hand domain-containing protein n=1 Tax=Sporothrix brasiliensis 5110 TaxID=1398154 RepID=A0A0C2F3P8_9PEZI|nr:uncharacterized protein SPBR_04435 [Sporothrix brasiliensis 5110]KIH93539.1 hypothetical protein SPBR_04435 [Sporothrix brasiliensis 5110]
MLPLRLLAAAGFLAVAMAHGDHSPSKKPEVGEDADWITRHMAEEHHIADFDGDSFFTLHDFDGDSFWTPSEIERTYGLNDASNDGLAPEKRAAVAPAVLALFDTDGDGRISRSEWCKGFIEDGKTLPDLGTGPGHHGDDEYEYEIHHWEKYHDENTKIEDLTHPEDIEHFKYHEELAAKEEAEEEARRAREALAIVWNNVPTMFRKARTQT